MKWKRVLILSLFPIMSGCVEMRMILTSQSKVFTLDNPKQTYWYHYVERMRNADVYIPFTTNLGTTLLVQSRSALGIEQK